MSPEDHADSLFIGQARCYGDDWMTRAVGQPITHSALPAPSESIYGQSVLRLYEDARQLGITQGRELERRWLVAHLRATEQQLNAQGTDVCSAAASYLARVCDALDGMESSA